MFGVFTLRDVKALEPGKRSLLDWVVDRISDSLKRFFQQRPGRGTYVAMTNSGFSGNGDKIVEQAMDSASGFALVLADFTAYLEFCIGLNLVADSHPEMMDEGLPTKD